MLTLVFYLVPVNVFDYTKAIFMKESVGVFELQISQNQVDLIAEAILTTPLIPEIP